MSGPSINSATPSAVNTMGSGTSTGPTGGKTAHLTSAEEKALKAMMSSDVSANPPAGTEKTLKLERDLLKGAGSKDEAISRIDRELTNPKLPKDARESLEGLKASITGTPHKLNVSQTNALETLKANPQALPITPENLHSKIDDKNTSPELKIALERVRDDPALAIALDTGDKRNGGGLKPDGTISQGDVDQLSAQQSKLKTTAATNPPPTPLEIEQARAATNGQILNAAADHARQQMAAFAEIGK